MNATLGLVQTGSFFFFFGQVGGLQPVDCVIPPPTGLKWSRQPEPSFVRFSVLGLTTRGKLTNAHMYSGQL